jgi:hypothetical protein
LLQQDCEAGFEQPRHDHHQPGHYRAPFPSGQAMVATPLVSS